jgi:hypothetical protein
VRAGFPIVSLRTSIGAILNLRIFTTEGRTIYSSGPKAFGNGAHEFRPSVSLAAGAYIYDVMLSSTGVSTIASGRLLVIQ